MTPARRYHASEMLPSFSKIAPLTPKVIAAAKASETDYFVWDATLPGFGVRIFVSGRKTFVVQWRDDGGAGQQFRRTVGVVGRITLTNAKSAARQMLDKSRSDYPTTRSNARSSITLAELYSQWLQQAAPAHRKTGVRRSKASIENDTLRMKHHVLPVLGNRSVRSLTRSDVEFVRDRAATARPNTQPSRIGFRGQLGGPQAARRVVATLKSILAFGVDTQFVSANVALGVPAPPDRMRQTFLNELQFREVFEAIQLARSQYSPAGCDVLSLLCLTGCRKSEIEALAWSQVSFESKTITVGTKTGPRPVHLSAPAIQILQRQSKTGSDFVFPAKGNILTHYQGTKKVWQAIRNQTGRPTFRIHDLRHSFASLLAKQGSSLIMIGTALGHKRAQTTMRYAHLTDAAVATAISQAATMLTDNFESN